MPSSVSAAERQAELDAVLASFQRSTPKKSGDLDKNAFLQILTAQLKYQDPMEGSDNSQFVAQMAQFSALEQMQNLNTSFAAMMAKQDILTGSMWIGKDVMVYDYSEGAVSGKVQGFALDSELGLLLAINGKEYTLDQVIAVKDPSEPWASEVGAGEETVPEGEDGGAGETDVTDNNGAPGDADSGESGENGDI